MVWRHGIRWLAMDIANEIGPVMRRMCAARMDRRRIFAVRMGLAPGRRSGTGGSKGSSTVSRSVG